MKNLRPILPALALALLAPGCILTSGQLLIDFDLPNMTATSPTGLIGEQINLNTNDDYEEHKDKLKDILDFAVLGTIHNTGVTDIDVEVWMTPDLTTYTNEASVEANGIKLWGPLHIPAGGSVAVDWDKSASLFSTLGKAAVLQEAKGDGSFTIYAIGNAGVYTFNIENGVLALVIDVGI
jgi:hypothetical protein